MATTTIQYREPVTFAQGDTLLFNRSLPDYLPSNGWSLLYEIRSAVQPTAPAIQFQSTPDATLTIHQISVSPAVTVNWLPGDSILVGFAVNVTGERHQIYYGELNLTPNLGTANNDVDVTTHAQRMIPLLEKALEELAAHTMLETDIERTKILREKRMDLEKQLALNKEIRANEVALENVKNGRPSGNKIKSQMNVIQQGTWGVGFPYFPQT